MPTTGLLRYAPPSDPKNPGSPEADPPPVRGHQPVAAAVGSGGHAHDRSSQGLTTHGPEEPGVTEGEHPAVRGHQPVAAAVGSGGHAHDRSSQGLATHGPEEPGVPEGE